MTSYSNTYRFELPADGGRTGTWGQMMNLFMGTLLEEALSGVVGIQMIADTNYTLTNADGASSDARHLVLNVTSSGAHLATRSFTIPSKEKVYSILNSTSGGQSIDVKTSGSVTSVVIPNGRRRFVFCDGTDVFDLLSDLPTGVTINGAAAVSVSGTQTLTNKTLTSPTITTPTLNVRDNAFTLQDQGTPSKQAQFELSGISNSTTRVFTLPDANTTVVGTDATQTLTNKTLTSPTINSPTINTPTIIVRDNVFTLQDEVDNTKQARFQLSGIDSGATRTITLPNSDFTIGDVADNTVSTNKIVDLNVTTAKIANGAVTPVKLSQKLTQAGAFSFVAPSATNSTGTLYTGIPNWVTRITIGFVDMTAPSGNNIYVRLGTSGGFITTSSYIWQSTAMRGDGGAAASVSGSSPYSSFQIVVPATTLDIHGHMIITNLDATVGSGGTWVASFNGVSQTTGVWAIRGAGYITITGAYPDRLQIGSTSGGNFASGVVSVMYE